MQTDNPNGWIGVDLDGTLAFYDTWRGADHIGEPVPAMLTRVLDWVKEGKLVKIFTARASEPTNIPIIEKWSMDYLGVVLPVTNVKDQDMIELWDDRAKQVVQNTGEIVGSEVVMENRILIRYNQVSAEALGFGVKKLTSEVASNLSSLLGSVSGFINDTVKPISNHIKFDFFDDDGVEDLLTKTNYVSITPIEIFVPAGMNVDMVTYLKTLEATQSVFNTIEKDVLKPSADYFAMLLATPETMGSVRNNEIAIAIEKYFEVLEKTTKQTTKCYAKHNYSNKRLHGDVFKRNSDWKTACDLITSITTDYNRFTPKNIWDSVNNICSILDRLVIRMEQSPDVYKPTGITSGDLADITFSLGKIIEAYAAYSYMLQMVSATMRDNVDVYKEILKGD